MSEAARHTGRTPVPDQFRWTVERFHQAIDAGVFGEEERIELVNGVLYQMVPPNPPHTYITETIAQQFVQTLDLSRFSVRNQQPVILGQDGHPMPDVLVAEGPNQRYVRRHPRADEVLLIVEVSDTTLERDRGEKLCLYAQAGIPEYWIVSIPQTTVQVCQYPQGETYHGIEVFITGQIRTQRLDPSVSINVEELFAGL